MKSYHVAVVLAAFLAQPAVAQQPAVTNGTLDVQAVTGPLDREFAAAVARDAGPAWIGYAIPVARRDSSWGCWSNDTRMPAPRTGPVQLEGPDTFFVLYRIDERRVERIRMFSAECPLDAGGLTVHWLSGVRASDSVSWLATFTTGDAVRRLANSAIAAIAMHRDVTATDRLISLARTNDSARVRSDALFWLGQRAGDRAVGTISDAIDHDPDTEVKKKAVFALSQLPKDEGVPRLIAVAQENRNSAVRKQAMFWLGQSGDPRALRYFEEILGK